MADVHAWRDRRPRNLRKCGGRENQCKPGNRIGPSGPTNRNGDTESLNLRGEAGEYDIYCLYDERETDSRLEGGVEGNTRIEEAPEFIQLLTSQNAEAPENGVRLARLRINEAGSLVAAPDNSIRNFAGAVLPDALDLRTLRLERDGVDQRDWPVLSCSRRNKAGLDGNLLVEGNLSVNGFHCRGHRSWNDRYGPISERRGFSVQAENDDSRRW